MRTHIVDDLADAREQPGIGKDRLAHGDAVPTELGSLPDQPDSVSQGANWHRSVIGRHAAKFVAGDERRVGAQDGGTVRGEHTGRSGTNNDDVRHAYLLAPARAPSTARVARAEELVGPWCLADLEIPARQR